MRFEGIVPARHVIAIFDVQSFIASTVVGGSPAYRRKTGARRDEHIAAIVIGEAFRHRTAARVADADEKNPFQSLLRNNLCTRESCVSSG